LTCRPSGLTAEKLPPTAIAAAAAAVRHNGAHIYLEPLVDQKDDEEKSTSSGGAAAYQRGRAQFDKAIGTPR